MALGSWHDQCTYPTRLSCDSNCSLTPCLLLTQDLNVLPSAFTDGSVKFLNPDLNDKGQLKNVLLEKYKVDSIDKVGLSGIILSHAHVDHYGNLLDFPTSLPVFVGPGTMDWVGGGEDAAKRGEKGLMSFPSSFLKNRTFIEMNDVKSKASDKIKSRVKETKVGPFEKAWDWFGDGSIVIASAEGVSIDRTRFTYGIVRPTDLN